MTAAMTPLSVTAKTAAGDSYPIANPREIRVRRSLESPAESAEVLFFAAKMPAALLSLTIQSGENVLFAGNIDRQTATISDGGLTVRLEARSIGALLLDNQAVPGLLQNARPQAVFDRLAVPYGFVVYCPNARGVLPLFTIRAGQSEWDALCAYCRRMFGRTPYVTKKQVMVERPVSQSPLVISNTGDGLRFSSLAHVRTPYAVISQVNLRDENGYYTARVRNSAAVGLGQTRRRFVVPSNEYEGYPALDANQRIRRSMMGYERAEVALPGAMDAALGRDARIKDRAIEIHNLMVLASELLCSADGVVTKLSLGSSVYYD